VLRRRRDRHDGNTKSIAQEKGIKGGYGTMTIQLREIGGRLAALREICDISVDDFAKQCGITAEQLEAYERGEKDFSFSFLQNAAGFLGVDVVELMSGETPRLSSCCVTKAGQGFAINRRESYNYRHLAFTFRNKKAEPFMVTVEPKGDSASPTLHAHAGHEFNYLVEGALDFYHGDRTYRLETGDSVYFDAGIPHAMKAAGGTAKFIALVME
jgi:transcriptional regulator with XRE-family HTH domain